MKFPANYEWLLKESGPKILKEALTLYGVEEFSGPKDNPVILGWAKELNLNDYVHDSIAWCGLATAISVHKAGYEIVKEPLWALNWAKWGNASDVPKLGDILTFKRSGGGHVGLYVGEDTEAYHVFGGNQSDRYGFARISKDRLFSARRTPWKIGQPDNVRVVYLKSTGGLSINEA